MTRLCCCDSSKAAFVPDMPLREVVLQQVVMYSKERPAALVPNLPRHLATPSLMERAGDPAFYDEPELGRTTPPAERPPSQFTPSGQPSLRHPCER